MGAYSERSLVIDGPIQLRHAFADLNAWMGLYSERLVVTHRRRDSKGWLICEVWDWNRMGDDEPIGQLLRSFLLFSRLVSALLRLVFILLWLFWALACPFLARFCSFVWLISSLVLAGQQVEWRSTSVRYKRISASSAGINLAGCLGSCARPPEARFRCALKSIFRPILVLSSA